MQIKSIEQTAGQNAPGTMDENEFIAVITAAIFASASGLESNLTVRRITRTPSRRPAWNQAGLNDVIASRTL